MEVYAEIQPNVDYEEAMHFIEEEEESQSYEEALKIDVGKVSMKNELKKIEKNQTWSLLTPPKDSHSIDLKWVFKLNKNLDGTIIKHKARLVEKGYLQKFGIDFTDVFSPASRMETI